MLHPQRAGGLCSSAPTLVAAPGPSRRCPLARSRPGGAAVRRAEGKEERAVGAGSSLKEQEQQQQQEQQPRVTVDYEDPDATYGIRSITNAGRAAGRFGRPYKLPSSLPSWMYKWMRDPLESRKHDELVELVVLNERLAGGRAHEVRQKLDWLRRKTSNWDYIYQYITACDGKATLQMVEEANQKVEEALREQDTTSVETMQAKLLGLQEEISEASDKLRLSESRVSTNLRRVDDLKAEAASLERIRLASGPTSTVDQEQEGIQSRLRESRGASTSYAHEQPRTSQAWRSPRSKKNRRLRSSLELEDRLRNFWYPAEFSKTLEPGVMVPFDLFNTPWVLFRDETGAPACIKDSCAHRACPLSLGKLVDGHVQCAYHGWEFDGTGTCTKMPSTKLCSGVGVAALPCFEKDGFVWVWPGDEPPKELPPDYTAPPPGYDVHAEIMVDVPVEHGLMLENLLDLAHAPFTHTTTFARGWPIPDAVRFHATRMLAGDWDPYPISMSFNPPCIVLSTIGLSQPGKIMRGYRADQCKRHLHQLHVCMPAKRGHTRLLYRMSLDFWGWLRHVPFIEQLWKQIAGQVLGEDLVLVQGQQERLIAGDDTWNMPMPYDKLAVRYRRWRNMVADGEYEAGARIAAQANMSAGQMFSDEEETDGDDGDADDGSTSNGQPWRQQQQQQQAKGSRVKEEHLDEAAVQRR